MNQKYQGLGQRPKPFKFLHFLLLRLFRFSYLRPKSTVAIFIGAWLVLLPGFKNLRVLISTSEMIPDHSVAAHNRDQSKKLFNPDDTLAILATTQNKKAFTHKQLCEIRNWVSWLTFSQVNVTDVQSIFHFRTATSSDDRLNYFLATDLDCENNAGSITGIKLSNNPFENILISQKQNALYIEISVSPLESPQHLGTFDEIQIKKIESSIKKLEKLAPEVDFHLQGASGVKWHFLKSMIHDQSLNLLISALLLILFKILYGTFVGGILLLSSIGLTVGILAALMNTFSIPFDILTNSLFVIICLAATEDFLYLSEGNRTARNQKSFRKSFAAYLTPSLFTSITTVIGFGSLALSDIEPIQRLGLWAAVGALIEWAVTFFYIPALITIFPKYAIWTKPGENTARRFTFKFSQLGFPKWALRLALIAMAVLAINIPHIKSNDSVDQIWTKHHDFNQGMMTTLSQFGWAGNIELVIREKTPVNRRKAIKEQIRTLHGVSKIESSDGLERAFLASLHEMESSERKDTYIDIARRELHASEDMRRYRSQTSDAEKLFLYVNSIDSQFINELRTKIDQICLDSCFVTGELINHSIFSDSVIDTLIKSFIFSLFLVSLVLIWLCFVLKESEIFAVVFSSIWGPVFLLGLLSYVLPGINFVTCIFASVLVGLAGDNSIQYLFASDQNGVAGGVDRRKQGTVNISLILAIASLAFLLSDFKQPKILGVLFSVGYLILLVGDLWILKGLIRKKSRPT